MYEKTAAYTLPARLSGISNHVIHIHSAMVQILPQPCVSPVVGSNTVFPCRRIVHIITLLELVALFHLDSTRHNASFGVNNRVIHYTVVHAFALENQSTEMPGENQRCTHTCLAESGPSLRMRLPAASFCLHSKHLPCSHVSRTRAFPSSNCG